VLLIRNYSIKRIIVKEGEKTGDGRTPPGAIPSETRGADIEPSQDPEEKLETSVGDLEKGLNGSEDGTVDVKDEKDGSGEGSVKKD